MNKARKPLILIAFLLLAILPVGTLWADPVTVDPQANSQFVTDAHNIKQKLFASENTIAQPGTEVQPLAEEKAQSGISIMRLFQGLAFCLGIFFVGIHLYRKFILKGAPPAQRTMRILERLVLGNKSSLVLIEIENKKVLVALGADKLLVLENNDLESYITNEIPFENNQQKDYADVAKRSNACNA